MHVQGKHLKVKENGFRREWPQWKWILLPWVKSLQPNDAMLCKRLIRLYCLFFEKRNFRGKKNEKKVIYRSRSVSSREKLSEMSWVPPEALDVQNCSLGVAISGGVLRKDLPFFNRPWWNFCDNRCLHVLKRTSQLSCENKLAFQVITLEAFRSLVIAIW